MINAENVQDYYYGDDLYMKRIEIRELNTSFQQLDGKEVFVCGWVRTIRDSKTFGFIEINDGTFFKNLQVVFDDSLENFQEIRKLGVGSAIKVKGNVVLTPQAKQPYEVKATSVEVEGACPSDYPLQKKRHSFEFLRTIAHLRPRTNTFQQCSGFVRYCLTLFINSSRKEDLSMCILLL